VLLARGGTAARHDRSRVHEQNERPRRCSPGTRKRCLPLGVEISTFSFTSRIRGKSVRCEEGLVRHDSRSGTGRLLSNGGKSWTPSRTSFDVRLPVYRIARHLASQDDAMSPSRMAGSDRQFQFVAFETTANWTRANWSIPSPYNVSVVLLDDQSTGASWRSWKRNYPSSWDGDRLLIVRGLRFLSQCLALILLRALVYRRKGASVPQRHQH